MKRNSQAKGLIHWGVLHDWEGTWPGIPYCLPGDCLLEKHKQETCLQVFTLAGWTWSLLEDEVDLWCLQTGCKEARGV